MHVIKLHLYVMPEVLYIDREGSCIETAYIVLNKNIMVHYSNTTAENMLAGTAESHPIRTVLIRAD